MNVSKYVLDANVFIEAKNRYYGFEICPGFWTSLVDLNNSKLVFCIDRIRDELVAQNDDIKDWVENRSPDTFFKQTQDQAVFNSFQAMVNWVYSQSQFVQAAKTEFASVADGWLLAYAHSNNLTVVTHEEFAPQARRKVPMPNVCLEFGIDYVNTFQMLADLNVKFIRSTKNRK